MEIYSDILSVQQRILHWKYKGKSIGFVPTMGYLHEGHERLLQQARKENDIVVLSIFVNPLQFGENEDLDHYPRDEKHDREVAGKYGVDLIFFPRKESMYPKPLSIAIMVVRRASVLCGKSRPGHFDGVVTVLMKLFNIIQPTRAYFGMKDAQQVAVTDALIEDFNFPVDLIPVPTVREEDGLAKSSRNVNLSARERLEAPTIYKALTRGRELVAEGMKNTQEILLAIREFLENRTHGKIDYIELLSYPELEPLDHVNQNVVLAIAVYYEKARLIDNVIFDQQGKLIKGKEARGI